MSKTKQKHTFWPKTGIIWFLNLGFGSQSIETRAVLVHVLRFST